MSRSGYNDDYDDALAIGRWRAQVASASRGKRGQQFFRDLIAALDALPEPRLARNELETDGEVCALGALGRARGIELSALDTHDHDSLGEVFGIAHQLAQETMYINDEYGSLRDTPEDRWRAVRRWAVRQLTPETLLASSETRATKDGG